MSCFKTCLLACAVSCCAATASAGVLSGFAGALLSGSTPYQGYADYPFNTIPTNLTGYIDYAVFSPGSFPTGLGQFSGYTPTAGQFVYTYQLFETGTAPVSNLSVTLWALALANNIGSFSGLGVSGQSPIAVTGSYFFPDNITPTSANWDFAPGVAISLLNPAGSTSGLAFSSPYGPIMLDGGAIDDGSFAVVIPLPSPAPEPSTLMFWSCGIVFCAVRWLRRRGHKAGR